MANRGLRRRRRRASIGTPGEHTASPRTGRDGSGSGRFSARTRSGGMTAVILPKRTKGRTHQQVVYSLRHLSQVPTSGPVRPAPGTFIRTHFEAAGLWLNRSVDGPLMLTRRLQMSDGSPNVRSLKALRFSVLALLVVALSAVAAPAAAQAPPADPSRCVTVSFVPSWTMADQVKDLWQTRHRSTSTARNSASSSCAAAASATWRQLRAQAVEGQVRVPEVSEVSARPRPSAGRGRRSPRRRTSS
jgi:hypothetical protein